MIEEEKKHITFEELNMYNMFQLEALYRLIIKRLDNRR
jgi:hypothetical protein